MKKILAFFRVGFQITFAYRAESLVWFLLEFIGLIPIIGLWLYMYHHGRMDFSVTSYLITYFILSLFISRLTAAGFEDWVIDQIKDGQVSTTLLKPMSYMRVVFTQELTWRLFGLIYLIPTSLFVYLLLGPMVTAGLSFKFLIPSLFMLVITLFQRLWFSWLISTTAFWIDQSKTLTHLKWILEGTLGGSWLPLVFFPVWFQTISKFTPFYYWYNFSIDLFLGKLNTTQIVGGIFLHLTWLVILSFFGNAFWRLAIKKYSAVGG